MIIIKNNKLKMLSNRTANFTSIEKKDEMKQEEENFVKLHTAPLSKFDMNFHFKDEEIIKDESSFSFKDNLLTKNTYDFLKIKDECLSNMVLDDSIPNKN